MHVYISILILTALFCLHRVHGVPRVTSREGAGEEERVCEGGTQTAANRRVLAEVAGHKGREKGEEKDKKGRMEERVDGDVGCSLRLSRGTS